ncbi:unnamed protein product, partial [Effrenium voratum]
MAMPSLDIMPVQVLLGSAAAPEVWSAFVSILPEYGLEPITSVMQDTIALARRKVKELPGCDSLLEQIEQLQGAAQ